MCCLLFPVKRYVLWLGNESDFSRVQRSVGSHAKMVSFARMSQLMTWFTLHSAEAPEAMRLVTSRVRQGDGDEQVRSCHKDTEILSHITPRILRRRHLHSFIVFALMFA